jgi:hypothetical protein
LNPSWDIGYHEIVKDFLQSFQANARSVPLLLEEGSDYYWSLSLYWGVALLPLTHSITHSLTTITQMCLQVILYRILRSRDSSVGIATDYELDDKGVGV